MTPTDPEKSLADSGNYAHKSLRCDPYCQEGHIALATSLLFKGNFTEAVATLEQGAKLNQRNSDYRASMGALLIYMGYYDRGKEILDSAFQLTPELTWWHVLAFSFHSFIKERYQDAIFWADRIEMSVCRPALGLIVSKVAARPAARRRPRRSARRTAGP